MRIGIIIIMLLMVSNITKAQNKEGINNSKLKKQITQELNKVDFEIPDYMKKEIDAIGGLDQFYFDAITLFLKVKDSIPRAKFYGINDTIYNYSLKPDNYQIVYHTSFDSNDVFNISSGLSYSTEYIPKRTGTDSSPEYTDWRNDKEYYKGYNYNRFQFYAKHFEIACNYLIFRKNKVDFSLKDEIRERKQSARELRDYNKKLKKESKKPEQLDSTILAQIHAQPTTYTFFEDSLKTFDSLVINGLNNVLHKILDFLVNLGLIF